MRDSSKAFLTIIDTHVTTVVSCAFLFLFGTGPVKGFAVTLVIGLIANVFTAVFVSRTIFDWELGMQKQCGNAKHLDCALKSLRFCGNVGKPLQVGATGTFGTVAGVCEDERELGRTGSMELFKNTNFDFLGKKWPFIGALAGADGGRD